MMSSCPTLARLRSPPEMPFRKKPPIDGHETTSAFLGYTSWRQPQAVLVIQQSHSNTADSRKRGLFQL